MGVILGVPEVENKGRGAPTVPRRSSPKESNSTVQGESRSSRLQGISQSLRTNLGFKLIFKMRILVFLSTSVPGHSKPLWAHALCGIKSHTF